MRPSILTDWSPEKSAALGREPLQFRHRLHERLMFTDAGLIEAIDRYPRERLLVFTMGDDPVDSSTWRRGIAGDLTPAELLAACRDGRLCLMLKGVERHHPAYAALLADIFADKARFAPQVRISQQELTLVISSPGAHSCYQADLSPMAMFQVRGRRSLFLYPATEPFVTEEHLERRALGLAGRHLAHNPAFESSVRRLTLAPGCMATWPEATPFRTVNDDMNVVVLAEFMTPAARMRADIVYANAKLRRSFGGRPAVQAGLHPKALTKAALGRMLQGMDRGRRFPASQPQFKLALSRAAA